MTTTLSEKLAAIKAACKAVVEAGEKATPRPWREGTLNVWQDDLLIPVCCTHPRRYVEKGKPHLLNGGDKIEWLQEDCRYIALACNAGVAACKGTIIAIEAFEGHCWETEGDWLVTKNAREGIAQAWEGAV